MKKTLLGLFGFFILLFNAAGQVRSISGAVTSADDGQPLPGVTVQVKGTTTGTTTDIEGKFKLTEVTPETVLLFSFVGFVPMEITIGDKLYIDVQMATGAEQLTEVVVTALGIKRQQREIGYSTEKIDADLVVESKAQNVISAITGRSAGVQVSQADGVEGGSTRIIIRGNNNIGNDKNNQPLIVVDNIPIENNPGLTDIGRGVDWGSAINDLNAYDIIYTSGQGNAGGKTIAINLPNDEKVQLAKGSRRLQLKNAMKAKFENILVPIAGVVIDSTQRGQITFDAFFEDVMFHEVAHGLGIKNTINGKGTVRDAMKEKYSSFEEAKADIAHRLELASCLKEDSEAVWRKECLSTFEDWLEKWYGKI